MNSINEFEKFLVVYKGLSSVTVNGHIKSIKRISKHITLKKEDVDNYIFSLYKSKFSWSYKESQIKTIEYWFEFNNNPIHFARQRKPKPIIKQTLTESEITKILFCCKNIREKSIIATLAYSGIRPKELTTLKLQDIDFGSNEIKIKQGKGLKDSVIYISSSCVKLLIEYITKYPRNQQDLLFKTSDGLRAFNTECLRKLIKQLSKKSQIYKRVYPYIFRHSLATTMINRGADILTVMKQLRHENLETTMLYIHSFGYSPKNEYEKFAPSYL